MYSRKYLIVVPMTRNPDTGEWIYHTDRAYLLNYGTFYLEQAPEMKSPAGVWVNGEYVQRVQRWKVEIATNTPQKSLRSLVKHYSRFWVGLFVLRGLWQSVLDGYVTVIRKFYIAWGEASWVYDKTIEPGGPSAEAQSIRFRFIKRQTPFIEWAAFTRDALGEQALYITPVDVGELSITGAGSVLGSTVLGYHPAVAYKMDTPLPSEAAMRALNYRGLFVSFNPQEIYNSLPTWAATIEGDTREWSETDTRLYPPDDPQGRRFEV